MKKLLGVFILSTALSAAASSAFAQAAQWMGGATVTFSPKAPACTGVINSLSPSGGFTNYASGSDSGLGGYNTGFSAYNKSTKGGGGFVFVFDEPLLRWTYGTGGTQTTATFISDVYNRKFVVSALSGGVAGLFFPNVSVTGTATYNYPNVHFNGTDLQGTIVVNYTASGMSCQMTASFIGIDAGGINQ